MTASTPHESTGERGRGSEHSLGPTSRGRDDRDRHGDRDRFRHVDADRFHHVDRDVFHHDDHHHDKVFRHRDRDFIIVSFSTGFWWPWWPWYDYYWPSYYNRYGYNYYPYEPYYYPYEPYYGGGYGAGDYGVSSPQDVLALGSQYFAQGDYQQAKDSFLKAMIAQPENPQARFAYGQALFALGQYQSAAEAIRQGLALDLTWPQVEMDLRGAYGDPSEFARQLGKLESYLAAHPEDADARFLLGYNLYFSGQKDRAREEFSKLAQANPLDKAPELFLDYLSGTSGPATSTGPVTPSTPAPQAGAPAY